MKRKHESDDVDGLPQKGDTLDSEDVRQRMQKEMAKLQGQLIKVQPKAMNTTHVEKVKVAVGESQRKCELRKVADLSMRGTTHVNILARDPSHNDDIILGLRLANSEDFHPSLESSGLISLPVPLPKDEELKQLRRAVNTRCDSCKDGIRNLHKRAVQQCERLSAYSRKDEIFLYKKELNKLVHDQCVLVDGIQARKLKEFM